MQETTNVVLSPLSRADGSASYTSNGISVIGAVNGPIEVQRRDELPEEAAIDVIIRPASGVGGIRERHFESILEKTLRHVILVSAHPRTLIQITLQIVGDQVDESIYSALPQASSNLPVLPAAFQTALLALLSTSIPLSMTMTSTLISVDSEGRLTESPSWEELNQSSSIHVFAFSSHGELLLVESEGECGIDTWEEVHVKAVQICRGRHPDSDSTEDIDMDLQDKSSLEDTLRSVVQEKVAQDLRWKHNLE